MNERDVQKIDREMRKQFLSKKKEEQLAEIERKNPDTDR
jgi:hypothetical protein